MIKKPIPYFLRGTWVERLVYSEAAVYFSYWVFQGFLYMDNRERVFKIMIDIALFGVFYKTGMSWLLAVVLAHTCNMFINGHVVAMRRHMGHGVNNPKKFIAYADGLYERIKNQRYIVGAAAYGSLSRNNFKPTSDMDIRVFPYPGSVNWILLLMWLLSERIRAIIYGFPLDLYAFDFDIIDKKMRTDEPPIVFSDPKLFIENKYGEIVNYPDFSAVFKATYVR